MRREILPDHVDGGQGKQNIADGFEANQQDVSGSVHVPSGYSPGGQWQRTDLQRRRFSCWTVLTQQIQWGYPAGMSEPLSKNIFWTPGKVTAEQRGHRIGQSGCVIWLTGLSASGKSTIATELERELFNQGRLAYVLDGDNTRHGLCSDLGFSPEDRRENIRRVREVGRLFADAGIICITAFISPYRADRDAGAPDCCRRENSSKCI